MRYLTTSLGAYAGGVARIPAPNTRSAPGILANPGPLSWTFVTYGWTCLGSEVGGSTLVSEYDLTFNEGLSHGDGALL